MRLKRKNSEKHRDPTLFINDRFVSRRKGINFMSKRIGKGTSRFEGKRDSENRMFFQIKFRFSREKRGISGSEHVFSEKIGSGVRNLIYERVRGKRDNFRLGMIFRRNVVEAGSGI